MRPKGGMFLNVDLDKFDASFFGIGGAEATATDPNQRQLLEVMFEGLESAGVPLEKIDGEAIGCFVGSYSSGKHRTVTSLRYLSNIAEESTNLDRPDFLTTPICKTATPQTALQTLLSV